MYLVAVLFKILSFSHPSTSKLPTKRKSQAHGAPPTAAETKAARRAQSEKCILALERKAAVLGGQQQGCLIGYRFKSAGKFFLEALCLGVTVLSQSSVQWHK